MFRGGDPPLFRDTSPTDVRCGCCRRRVDPKDLRKFTSPLADVPPAERVEKDEFEGIADRNSVSNWDGVGGDDSLTKEGVKTSFRPFKGR